MGELFRSDDGGSSWYELGTHQLGGGFTTVTYDSNTSQFVIIDTESRVFVLNP